LFIKGATRNGRVGIYYALQRAFSEFLLSLYLIENDLNIKRRRKGAEQAQDKVLETGC
jgi:hypothetical protein